MKCSFFLSSFLFFLLVDRRQQFELNSTFQRGPGIRETSLAKDDVNTEWKTVSPQSHRPEGGGLLASGGKSLALGCPRGLSPSQCEPGNGEAADPGLSAVEHRGFLRLVVV